MEIIVGTYEEILLGYRLEPIPSVPKKEDKESTEKYTLEQFFTNHAHTGSIRSVGCTPRLLASGSTDEVVRIFNLRSRVEVGSLMEHQGSITALRFYKSSHMFSGSEDGMICVWRVRNWVCEKTLRGHQKGVTSLSVHPSGKLLLSVSNDKTLRTWNLIKGRSAYITNIKAVADIVEWSLNGHLYAVVIGNCAHIYNVQTAGVIHKIDFGKKILCVAFLTNDVIAIGGEGNNIEIHKARESAILCVFTAHTNRIKALQLVNSTSEDDNVKWLVSASSDGFIKVWQLDVSQLTENPVLIAKVDTTCRITCLAVRHPNEKTGGQSEQNEGSEEEESEEEEEGDDEPEVKEPEVVEEDETDSKKQMKRNPTDQQSPNKKRKRKA